MIGAASGSANRQFQLISTTTITSTGSQDYTVPSGTAYLVFECYGSGGGGGGGNLSLNPRGAISYKGGGGGGGGSVLIHRYESELLIDGDVIRFTVGIGGVEGADTGLNGHDGYPTFPVTHRDSGKTTIKYTFSGPTAGGGGGGLSPTTFSTGGGIAGTASGANLFNKSGYAGGNNHASLGNGGTGGASVVTTTLQDPEESFIATTINSALDDAAWSISSGVGAGGIVSTSMPATDGSSPGNGGGGGYNKLISIDTSGGAGGNGKVIVRAYG